MEPRLSLKMTQRLVLTPTLQQAIKLLQYSRQELVQYVRQELLENPTLEEVQSAEISQEAPVGEAESPPEKTDLDTADVVAGEGEPDWSEFVSEFDNGYEPYHAAEAPSYENVLSSGTSLQGHLFEHTNIVTVVRFGHVGEPDTQTFVVGADQRVVSHQVDMIGHDGQVAWRQLGVHATDCV